MSATILAIVALAVALYDLWLLHEERRLRASQDAAALRRLWERYEGDGLTVKKPSDKPLSVEVNRD